MLPLADFITPALKSVTCDWNREAQHNIPTPTASTHQHDNPPMDAPSPLFANMLTPQHTLSSPPATTQQEDYAHITMPNPFLPQNNTSASQIPTTPPSTQSANTQAETSPWPEYPGVDTATRAIVREMEDTDIINCIIEVNQHVATGAMSRELGIRLRVIFHEEIRRRVYIR